MMVENMKPNQNEI